MAATRLSWPELERDEWVRRSWPARCRTGTNGSASSYSDGTLILTNRRLFFTGLSELDELPVFNFDELLLVRCHRHGVFLNTLTLETESGRRFEFRTKKMACKQIAARSQMRTVATSRSPVVRITPCEFRLSAGK